MIKIALSKNCQKIPPYIFLEIDRLKDEAIEKGADVIDLGVGDPDRPTPKRIVEAMKKAVENPENHRYPFGPGMLKLREKIAEYYKINFKVEIDPKDEVMALLGSKEGIAHIHPAFLDLGDVVLIPEPGYPVYSNMTVMNGGTPYFMPLVKENNFLPDMDSIPKSILKKTKLIWINYPNNPTSALANKEFFEKVVEIASKYNIIVCHDAAYIDVGYDGYEPLSFLSIDGAKEVGIEFYSLSKTFNMTGWRIGFALGNRDVIKGLGKVKANVDSGVFQAVQYAGLEALSFTKEEIKQIMNVYKERRDVIVPKLKEMGWEVTSPRATFYVWAKIPSENNSMEMAKLILEKCAVIVTPGLGLGKSGEKYIRLALTVEKERLLEAAERLRKL
jgi:LL-diaminopimelate aminotransferase